jgi:hypothetical protein
VLIVCVLLFQNKKVQKLVKEKIRKENIALFIFLIIKYRTMLIFTLLQREGKCYATRDLHIA